MVMFLSTRLDETGTDGRSRYAVVAGAISPASQWDSLELAWGLLLQSRRVKAFHTKEFRERKGDFAGWSDLKARNFSDRQRKIVDKHAFLEVAVAVDREAHARVKKEMQGIKGFGPNSDCGFCFRVLTFVVCDWFARKGLDARISFMIEAGPWGGDACVIYNDICQRGHSKHGHMLNGFAVVPKGQRFSLEAADYIAGVCQPLAEARAELDTTRRLGVTMDEDFIRRWHQDMLNEKERRRAFFHRANPSKLSPS